MRIARFDTKEWVTHASVGAMDLADHLGMHRALGIVSPSGRMIWERSRKSEEEEE